MFQCVKFSVLMGQSEKTIKKMLTFETISNYEDGIKYFFEKLTNW